MQYIYMAFVFIQDHLEAELDNRRDEIVDWWIAGDEITDFAERVDGADVGGEDAGGVDECASGSAQGGQVATGCSTGDEGVLEGGERDEIAGCSEDVIDMGVGSKAADVSQVAECVNAQGDIHTGNEGVDGSSAKYESPLCSAGVSLGDSASDSEQNEEPWGESISLEQLVDQENLKNCREKDVDGTFYRNTL